MKKAFSWIHTEEGQILIRVIQSLGTYAVGDPTGVIIPLILDSSDDIVRKRLLKNVPDMLNKLDSVKSQIDEEFVKSEKGQKLLRETLQQLIEQDNQEKIEFHKKFLVNAFTARNVNVSKKNPT